MLNNYSYTIDDRDTILDQSTNQNIWADGDVHQIFDQEANIASGDQSNAAGGDIDVEDSYNDSHDVEYDVRDSFNDNSDNSDNSDHSDNSDNSIDVDIEDSLNDESDHSTDNSVDVDLEDSFNDESDHSTDNSVEVEDSFNPEVDVEDSFTYEDDSTIDLLKAQIKIFDAQAGTDTTVDSLPGVG